MRLRRRALLADGDGEADIHPAAGGDDGVGVEAAVGPHRELSPGPGVAHPPHRLPQEVGGAPSGVGPALAQPGHQHVAGSGGNGQQRVIAPLAGVAVVARPLLGQTVCLADRRIQVDGEWPVAGSGPSRPGPGQQLAADPIQLADVAPPEAAQEGPQGGWRLDYAADGASRPAGAQHVGVVNAVAASQRGCHQGQHLVSRIRTTRRISQVNMVVHQLAQSQVVGQGDRQQQSGIGYQAVIIKGNVDAIGAFRW